MPLGVIGATGSQILGTSVTYDPGVGQTRTITVGADTAFALGTYIQTLGTNVSYTGEIKDGGQIRVTYPTAPGPGQTQSSLDIQAEAEADWELIPNIQTKDLRFFGTWGALDATGTAWNDYRKGTLTKALLDAGTYGTAGTGSRMFGSHLLKGTDSFEEEAYIVRQTINAGRQSDLTASFDGVFTVTSPPTPNSYAKFTMSTIGSAYEWLKRPPSVRATTKGFQITQEWWGVKQWSSSLYSGGSGLP